jgi:hypothetical protein
MAIIEAKFPGATFFLKIDPALWREIEEGRREGARYSHGFKFWE